MRRGSLFLIGRATLAALLLPLLSCGGGPAPKTDESERLIKPAKGVSLLSGRAEISRFVERGAGKWSIEFRNAASSPVTFSVRPRFFRDASLREEYLGFLPAAHALRLPAGARRGIWIQSPAPVASALRFEITEGEARPEPEIVRGRIYADPGKFATARFHEFAGAKPYRIESKKIPGAPKLIAWVRESDRRMVAALEVRVPKGKPEAASGKMRWRSPAYAESGIGYMGADLSASEIASSRLFLGQEGKDGRVRKYALSPLVSGLSAAVVMAPPESGAGTLEVWDPTMEKLRRKEEVAVARKDVDVPREKEVTPRGQPKTFTVNVENPEREWVEILVRVVSVPGRQPKEIRLTPLAAAEEYVSLGKGVHAFYGRFQGPTDLFGYPAKESVEFVYQINGGDELESGNKLAAGGDAGPLTADSTTEIVTPPNRKVTEATMIDNKGATTPVGIRGKGRRSWLLAIPPLAAGAAVGFLTIASEGDGGPREDVVTITSTKGAGRTVLDLAGRKGAGDDVITVTAVKWRTPLVPGELIGDEPTVPADKPCHWELLGKFYDPENRVHKFMLMRCNVAVACSGHPEEYGFERAGGTRDLNEFASSYWFCYWGRSGTGGARRRKGFLDGSLSSYSGKFRTPDCEREQETALLAGLKCDAHGPVSSVCCLYLFQPVHELPNPVRISQEFSVQDYGYRHYSSASSLLSYSVLGNSLNYAYSGVNYDWRTEAEDTWNGNVWVYYLKTVPRIVSSKDWVGNGSSGEDWTLANEFEVSPAVTMTLALVRNGCHREVAHLGETGTGKGKIVIQGKANGEGAVSASCDSRSGAAHQPHGMRYQLREPGRQGIQESSTGTPPDAGSISWKVKIGLPVVGSVSFGSDGVGATLGPLTIKGSPGKGVGTPPSFLAKLPLDGEASANCATLEHPIKTELGFKVAACGTQPGFRGPVTVDVSTELTASHELRADVPTVAKPHGDRCPDPCLGKPCECDFSNKISLHVYPLEKIEWSESPKESDPRRVFGSEKGEPLNAHENSVVKKHKVGIIKVDGRDYRLIQIESIKTLDFRTTYPLELRRLYKVKMGRINYIPRHSEKVELEWPNGNPRKIDGTDKVEITRNFTSVYVK